MESEQLIRLLVIVVPLVAGFALLGACAWSIFSNPQISNRNGVMLCAGALLCMVPTLASFQFEVPGGVKFVGVVKEQLGIEGAKLNAELADIKRSLELIVRRQTSPAAAPPPPVDPQNRGVTVLVLYSESKRAEAQSLEKALLAKGYAANKIYTDFSELPDASKGEPNTIRLVFPEQSRAVAERIKKEIEGAFPPISKAALRPTQKLSSGDVQIRMF